MKVPRWSLHSNGFPLGLGVVGSTDPPPGRPDRDGP